MQDQLLIIYFYLLTFSSFVYPFKHTNSLTFTTLFSLNSFIFTKLMDFLPPVKPESVEEIVLMEYDEEDNQLEAEFCPVEHPIEPEEEDRPVKCPVPISSALIHNSTEKTKPGWVKHRASCETPVYPPPRHVRNVRKRRNSFVEGDNSFFTRSMFSTSTHHEEETTSRRSTATTIYRVFQQVHEFEP